ncbi:ORF74 [White spot syndrome virus]|uniref:ORF74 n=1 Tax=White spot syndrome virus TaxID=342409 RepID=A0A2D3I5Z1_9VIRU|nr:ORF74 [White spot syndrome virus]
MVLHNKEKSRSEKAKTRQAPPSYLDDAIEDFLCTSRREILCSSEAAYSFLDSLSFSSRTLLSLTRRLTSFFANLISFSKLSNF